MKPLDLGDPALTRVIWRTALPAVGGLTINATHQGVDAFFVGQLGPDALAGVSLALPLTGITAALGVGLGVGTATAIGRALGGGRKDEAGTMASCAMGLCLVLALCLAAILWLARVPALDLLGAQGGVRAPALDYLSIMALSAGLGMIQILCDFTAIGEGNSKFSLLSLILCFGLNIALDPVLIFWAGFGVQGAAMATVIAQLATLALYVYYFTRGKSGIRVRPKISRSALAQLWPVLRIGLPETGSVLLASLAFVLLYRLAGQYQGADGQAAMGIALRLWILASLPIEGFCLGAQPVLSHAVGAGNTARLSRAALTIAAIATAAAVVFMLLGLLAAPQLSTAFTTAQPVQILAIPLIVTFAFSLPAMAVRFAAQVYLQATERVKMAAIVGLAPMGWLFLPLLLLSNTLWGFHGLALSLTLAAVVTGLGTAGLLLHLTRSSTKGLPA